MDKEPPLSIRIFLVVSYLILLLVYNVVFAVKTAPEGYERVETSFGELFYKSNMPITPDMEVLGVILYGIEIDPLLNEIIKCESNFNPDACNGEKCQYGRGLIQLVSETEKKCEKALNREINPFDPIDSLECGKYLFEEGTHHWGTENTVWGSFNCWSASDYKSNLNNTMTITNQETATDTDPSPKETATDTEESTEESTENTEETEGGDTNNTETPADDQGSETAEEASKEE